MERVRIDLSRTFKYIDVTGAWLGRGGLAEELEFTRIACMSNVAREVDSTILINFIDISNVFVLQIKVIRTTLLFLRIIHGLYFCSI